MIENYIVGDLFASLPKQGMVVIPHVCNDIGGWGSGFVVAVTKHFPKAEEAYRSWFAKDSDEHSPLPSSPFGLGNVQFVTVEDTEERAVVIANMVAQHETIATNPKPIRYLKLADCLEKVGTKCRFYEALYQNRVEIHAPKFGSDLARGNWATIEDLANEAWHDIPTTIYSLK